MSTQANIGTSDTLILIDGDILGDREGVENYPTVLDRPPERPPDHQLSVTTTSAASMFQNGAGTPNGSTLGSGGSTHVPTDTELCEYGGTAPHEAGLSGQASHGQVSPLSSITTSSSGGTGGPPSLESSGPATDVSPNSTTTTTTRSMELIERPFGITPIVFRGPETGGSGGSTSQSPRSASTTPRSIEDINSNMLSSTEVGSRLRSKSLPPHAVVPAASLAWLRQSTAISLRRSGWWSGRIEGCLVRRQSVCVTDADASLPPSKPPSRQWQDILISTRLWFVPKRSGAFTKRSAETMGYSVLIEESDAGGNNLHRRGSAISESDNLVHILDASVEWVPQLDPFGRQRRYNAASGVRQQDVATRCCCIQSSGEMETTVERVISIPVPDSNGQNFVDNGQQHHHQGSLEVFRARQRTIPPGSVPWSDSVSGGDRLFQTRHRRIYQTFIRDGLSNEHVAFSADLRLTKRRDVGQDVMLGGGSGGGRSKRQGKAKRGTRSSMPPSFYGSIEMPGGIFSNGDASPTSKMPPIINGGSQQNGTTAKRAASKDAIFTTYSFEKAPAPPPIFPKATAYKLYDVYGRELCDVWPGSGRRVWGASGLFDEMVNENGSPGVNSEGDIYSEKLWGRGGSRESGITLVFHPAAADFDKLMMIDWACCSLVASKGSLRHRPSAWADCFIQSVLVFTLAALLLTYLYYRWYM